MEPGVKYCRMKVERADSSDEGGEARRESLGGDVCLDLALRAPRSAVTATPPSSTNDCLTRLPPIDRALCEAGVQELQRLIGAIATARAGMRTFCPAGGCGVDIKIKEKATEPSNNAIVRNVNAGLMLRRVYVKNVMMEREMPDSSVIFASPSCKVMVMGGCATGDITIGVDGTAEVAALEAVCDVLGRASENGPGGKIAHVIRTA